jgi:hypothetical protein
MNNLLVFDSNDYEFKFCYNIFLNFYKIYKFYNIDIAFKYLHIVQNTLPIYFYYKFIYIIKNYSLLFLSLEICNPNFNINDLYIYNLTNIEINRLITHLHI